MHHCSLCVCSHMAIFSLCVSVSLLLRTPIILDQGPRLIQYDLILTCFSLPSSYFQVRPHSQVLGVRTSIYLVRDIIQPIIGRNYTELKEMEAKSNSSLNRIGIQFFIQETLIWYHVTETQARAVQDCYSGSTVSSGHKLAPFALLHHRQCQASPLKVTGGPRWPHKLLQTITGYKTEKKLEGQKDSPPNRVSSLNSLPRSSTRCSAYSSWARTYSHGQKEVFCYYRESRLGIAGQPALCVAETFPRTLWNLPLLCSAHQCPIVDFWILILPCAQPFVYCRSGAVISLPSFVFSKILLKCWCAFVHTLVGGCLLPGERCSIFISTLYVGPFHTC